jgi:SAM-dependent methyltransferase
MTRLETPESLKHLYTTRFPDQIRGTKDRTWSVLCTDFFQQYIEAGHTVIDLGAGYCEFINHVQAERRIAVDLNPETVANATSGVEVKRSLAECPSSSADLVFASNFFEHMPTKVDLLDMLRDIRRVLNPEGRLLLLQPNIRYCYDCYWDYFDHYLPLSHLSMQEALTLSGFDILSVRDRFLPYTFKSRLPKASWIIRLYLRLQPLHRVFGKQMLILSRPAALAAD